MATNAHRRSAIRNAVDNDQVESALQRVLHHGYATVGVQVEWVGAKFFVLGNQPESCSVKPW